MTRDSRRPPTASPAPPPPPPRRGQRSPSPEGAHVPDIAALEEKAAAGARVRGVDLARAVALIGMMGTHLLPEYDDAGRLTPWFWFAAGRSSALFALLAGVGLALATGGAVRRLAPLAGTATRVVVRALLIAAAGMALVALDPPIAVILTNYGLLFLFALPLLALRPAPLLAFAAGWGLAVPLLSQLWRTGLAAGPGPQIGFGDVAHPVDLLTRLALTGYYPVLTWLTYLAVGLAVGRMPLRQTRTAARLVLGGGALAVAAWAISTLLVRQGAWPALVRIGPADAVSAPLGPTQLQLRGLYGTTPTSSWWWQAVVSPHSGTTFDLAQTTGSALAVLGLALLVCRAVERSARTARADGLGGLRATVNGSVHALVCTGSMTLSLYSAHVVAADAQRDVASRGALLLAHVAVAMLVALSWRRWMRRGPLEFLVHTLSTGAGRVVGRLVETRVSLP